MFDSEETYVATQGLSQIHNYAGGSANLTSTKYNFYFSPITKFSHGHHARSGGGSDVMNFEGIDNVGTDQIIVGRLEDFDASRDQIWIEGTAIDLYNPPDHVFFIELEGLYDEGEGETQQYMVIENDSGGYIMYALEGARVDMDGTGHGGDGYQEQHFLTEGYLIDLGIIDKDTGEIDFSGHKSVAYNDPVNFVPETAPSVDGLTINDLDTDADDVRSPILGSELDDAIAAGLNDDVVNAGDGDDSVWGGSGEDRLNGERGKDVLHGGNGDDVIYGGRNSDELNGDDGNDLLCGQGGDDILSGGGGKDSIRGNGGDDMIRGGGQKDRLFGQAGDDILKGQDGDDILRGGKGADQLSGGDGEDRFVFASGEMINWDDVEGSDQTFASDFDYITDFEVGLDVIEFDGTDGVSSIDDISAWKTDVDGDMCFMLKIDSTNERIVVNTDEGISWGEFYTADNFAFG